MDFMPVWDKLSILPIILWLDEVFKEIENDLGLFYDVENLYKCFGCMGMLRIMNGLKLSKGMVDSIMIRKGFLSSLNP